MATEQVIVVQSSRELAEKLSGAIVRAGAEPRLMSTGDECLDALGQERPLMVITDLNTTPMAGDECCRRIKESSEWKDVPVVVMTAADRPHEVMYAWRAAADDFLPKPVDEESLASKVLVLRDAARESPPPEAGRRAEHGAGILFADVSRFYRRVLGGSLEHSGFRVLYAQDGDDVLDLLEEHADAIDAAVVDLQLPGTDGLTVAAQLRRHRSFGNKPLVMVSAQALSLPLVEKIEQLTGSRPVNKRLEPFEAILRRVMHSLRQDLLDLRSSERVPFFSMVEFAAEGGPWIYGFTYDVSKGGLFVRTLTPPRPGSHVQLRFRFPGDATPSISSGIVAWANPFQPRNSFTAPVGMGIRLTTIAPQLANQISSLVREDRPKEMDR